MKDNAKPVADSDKIIPSNAVRLVVDGVRFTVTIFAEKTANLIGHIVKNTLKQTVNSDKPIPNDNLNRLADGEWHIVNGILN